MPDRQGTAPGVRHAPEAAACAIIGSPAGSWPGDGRRRSRVSKQSSALEVLGNLLGDSADSTREQILDAALALFVEFGLRRNTMDDVASKAGVGRATVYRRFGDKDSLIQAVILRECQRNLSGIEKKIVRIENTLDGLLEAFVLAATQAHRHPLLVRVLSSEPEHILPHLTLSMATVMEFSRLYLAQQIKMGQQRGEIRDLGAEQTAELFLRLFQSLILSPKGVIDPDREDSLRAFAESHLRPLLQPQV